MEEFALGLFFAAIILIAIASVVRRFFYRKRTFGGEVSEKSFPGPTANASVRVMHSLSFEVPTLMQTNESAEASIEYIQGVQLLPGITYTPPFPFSFIFDRLELIPRGWSTRVRGFFASILATSKGKTSPRLGSDFLAQLTSSKFAVAPVGWQPRRKGTVTPCQWKWSVSCSEAGTYELVFDLDESFRRQFPGHLNPSSQVIFQVAVKKVIPLSHRFGRFIEGFGQFLLIASTVILVFVTLIAPNPTFQEFLSRILTSLP